MRTACFLLLASLLFVACNSSKIPTTYGAAKTYEFNNRPKNIILMIGDGMGISQITAALYMNDNRLNIERFPVVGIHKSYSGDDLITDSAAGATAFACGIKTYNGAIAVDLDSVPVKTILEEAEENGLATGLVATSTIVHATPASFIAHAKSRRLYEDIAKDFLETDIDFFVGGGKKFFDRRLTDDRNLYVELEEKGYSVSDYFKNPWSGLNLDPKTKLAYFTSDNEPLPYSNGRNYLVEVSKVAPEFLKTYNDNKGFFLMIESSQIDWGGHANDSDYIISEMKEFDEAIGVVLDFAERDGETLVIVTADHETGGYSINPGSSKSEIIPGFTSDKHSAEMIPVFAKGPGSEVFSGIYENFEIYNKMKAAFGFGLRNSEE